MERASSYLRVGLVRAYMCIQVCIYSYIYTPVCERTEHIVGLTAGLARTWTDMVVVYRRVEGGTTSEPDLSDIPPSTCPFALGIQPLLNSNTELGTLNFVLCPPSP